MRNLGLKNPRVVGRGGHPALDFTLKTFLILRNIFIKRLTKKKMTMRKLCQVKHVENPVLIRWNEQKKTTRKPQKTLYACFKRKEEWVLRFDEAYGDLWDALDGKWCKDEDAR